MKLVVAAALALPLLGATPAAPLVAGSVRDQSGAPVAGARVTLESGERVAARTITAPDGTFVVEGAGDRVQIRCAYCRTQSAPVIDGLATAVVYRYEAVAKSGLSGDDLASLPATRLESLLELLPFVVVNESSRTVPGASATDRNATPYGGLLVVDGAPDYDPNADVSTFDTVPIGASRSLSVERVNDAFHYGDLASGGTFVVGTPGGSSSGASGDGSLLRVGTQGSTTAMSASYSNAGFGDRRVRAAANGAFAMPGSTFAFALSSGDSDRAPSSGTPLRSAFSSLSATLESQGRIDSYATLVADRGSYDYPSLRFPQDASWSDSAINAGVRSRSVVAPFVDLSAHASSGWYEAAAPTAFSQRLSQARSTAGISLNTDRIKATFAEGADSITYRGEDRPISAHATDGVASVAYDDGTWGFETSVDAGYVLQTFLGSYQTYRTGSSPVEQGTANEATLSFGDRKRLRSAFTALRWSGASGAQTSAAGASLAWQIAPRLSARLWELNETSTLWTQALVGSTWLTYETDGLRVDAMWNRSLLDHAPYGHFDATLSGSITPRLWWFVSSQGYERRRATFAGVRIR